MPRTGSARNDLSNQRSVAAQLRHSILRLHPDSFVSISHVADLVVVAAAQAPIGVDVVDPDLPHERLARRFHLANIDLARRDYWTMWGVQEAHVKASSRQRLFPFRAMTFETPMGGGIGSDHRWYRFALDRFLICLVTESAATERADQLKVTPESA